MVVVSSFARFHADRLARQMARLGALTRVYTSYSGGFEGVSPSRIHTIPGLFPASYAAARIWPAASGRVTAVLSRVYDRAVARHLSRSGNRGAAGVLHAWETFSAATLRAAQRLGTATFLESSCPHPGPRGRLLREEAERVGARWSPEPGWEERIREELDLADFVVVPSTYTHRSFVDVGFPQAKLVKVPLGVDLSETPVIRTVPARFTVLMVGTDPLRKGATYLLDAWERLRLPGSSLVIRSGVPGPALGRIRRHSDVRHVPPVSRRELLALYRCATVFCFPSVDDGFGLVVLEAMAHGLPVIVTQNVGAADVVRDGVDGFVVPIRDPDALARRIEFFCRDGEAVRVFGRNARQRAEEYTWDRYGETLLDTYRSASEHT